MPGCSHHIFGRMMPANSRLNVSTTRNSLQQVHQPDHSQSTAYALDEVKYPARACASTPSSALPPIQIRCFGLFTVTCDGRNIDNWSRRKPRELLAYLATRPSMSATRQGITTALWPSYDQLSAGHLLRTTLWQLRRHLAAAAEAMASAAAASAGITDQSQYLVRTICGGQAVRRVGERYTLDHALCDCDLHAVRVNLADLQAMTVDGQSHHQPGEATRWLALAENASRPILQGESYEWLPALRRELRNFGLSALTRAMDASRSAGDLALALDVATRRLAVDPTHEETVEVAMRLHLERGSAAAGAACYRSFCAALARRYESVNPDLRRLHAALQLRPPQPDHEQRCGCLFLRS
ncbi:MAG: hypothetical protein ACHQ4H_05805, partial [Ktedonobacterales bacterium]